MDKFEPVIRISTLTHQPISTLMIWASPTKKSSEIAAFFVGRAMRSITFGRFTPFGGSAAIPLACGVPPLNMKYEI